LRGILSQHFNVLVLPARYRKWALKTHGMENPATSIVVKHVVNYTKRAIIQKAVDWNVVVEEFDGLPQLESFT
jgi:hypothetical protein